MAGRFWCSCPTSMAARHQKASMLASMTVFRATTITYSLAELHIIETDFGSMNIHRSIIVRGAMVFASLWAFHPSQAQFVSLGNRPAHCRGAASEMFGVKPIYVKTGRAIRARNGTTTIKGNADQGTGGIKPFMCRFDAKGRFVGVEPLIRDGD